MRRRAVNHHASGRHNIAVAFNAVVIAHVGVQNRGMTAAGKFHQGFGFCHGVFKILGFIHCQNRRKLFVRERLFRPDFRNFADNNFSIFRNFHTGHGGDFRCRLTDDIGVDTSVFQNGSSHFFTLFGVQNISAAFQKFCFNFIINGFADNHRLLRSANHPVIKGFRHQNRAYGHLNVGCFINNRRSVARTNAQSRSAGRIGGFYHARAAGRQNQISLLHKVLGARQARLINPSDNVFRSAGFHRFFQNYFCGFNRAFFSARVRRKDDAVTGLEGYQGFKNYGRSRVRGRNNAGNHADWLGKFNQAVFLVFFYNAASFGVFVLVINIFRRKVVFNHFIFGYAHAGFFHSHFSQWNTQRAGFERHAAENFIYLLLSVGGKFLLCGADFFYQSADVFLFFLFVIIYNFIHNVLLLIRVYCSG